MSEHDAERLRKLEDKLAAIRRREDAAKPVSKGEDQFSQANMAWRMVIELVSGLGIGFAIGYGLDWALGTTPWLLVIFILAGFAAGVKTMLGTARSMSQGVPTGDKQADDPADEDEGV